jgi:hypothetical protein
MCIRPYLYIMSICVGFVIPHVLVILFCAKKITQTNLRRLRMDCHRLAWITYDGPAQPRRHKLVGWGGGTRGQLTYDGPPKPS